MGWGRSEHSLSFSSPSLSLVSPHNPWFLYVMVLCPLFCKKSWCCHSVLKVAMAEEHRISVWEETGLGCNPGHGIWGKLLLASQNLSILICKMGIVIHPLHGISGRIKWANVHKALTIANTLCQVTNTCWVALFPALCFSLSRLNYCSRLLEYFIV